MDLDLPICGTCGAQYGAARSDCPICVDERQYVGWDGQSWTSLRSLSGHRPRIEPEGSGVLGVGTDPPTFIGQRALLVRGASGRNVQWDCITPIDDELVSSVAALGGVDAIAISHPHYYGTMIEFARAFDAPVFVHEADREWVARPDPSVTFWSGSTHTLEDGLTLINAGVHFAGGTVLHRSAGPDGPGALFSGDILQVVMDRRWVSFMYSYPNLIPERPAVILRALDLLAPYEFDRVYGAWWRRIVDTDGAAAVRRSAERYLRFALGE